MKRAGLLFWKSFPHHSIQHLGLKCGWANPADWTPFTGTTAVCPLSNGISLLFRGEASQILFIEAATLLHWSTEELKLNSNPLWQQYNLSLCLSCFTWTFFQLSYLCKRPRKDVALQVSRHIQTKKWGGRNHLQILTSLSLGNSEWLSIWGESD